MGCATSSAVKDSQSRFHDSYQLGRKLGEGAFGQVRAARERATVQEFAVKIIDVRRIGQYDELTSEVDQARVRDTKHEISIWKQIGQHDNCVVLMQCFVEETLYYMVMEKCTCSLMDRLVAMPTMTEGDLSSTFRDILLGIGHVHAHSIVHRDIKPDNFLYGGTAARTVKLCDFGLADRIPKKGGKLKGCFGTAPYMSPEMIAGTGYDQGTDVWSFAAMAYLMIFGDFPYMPKEVSSPAMKQAILSGVPEPAFHSVKEGQGINLTSFQDFPFSFVKTLLQRKPDQRCSAAEALQHTFLQPKVMKEDNAVRTNFKHARKITTDLKKPVNSIIQRGMDEILAKLQEKHGTAMYFSESRADEESVANPQEPELADDRIIKRCNSGRHSTHSGVISEKSIQLEDASENGESGSYDTLPKIHFTELRKGGHEAKCCPSGGTHKVGSTLAHIPERPEQDNGSAWTCA